MVRTCGVAGCTKPHRARGLCATHYNQQHQPDRHRKVVVPCGWCGKDCEKEHNSRRPERFCSLDCRDNMRAYRAREDHPRLVTQLTRWHCAHPDYRPPLPVLYLAPPRPPAQPRRPRMFTAGPCSRCGRPFVAEDPSRTANVCSKRCGKGRHRDRRRAIKKNAYVADVRRERIFRRDGYRCQLCHRKVRRDKVVPHPLAPVLDHIIPLAAGVEAGGVHAPHNVQCAHYMCNSVKRDQISNVQLALFG